MEHSRWNWYGLQEEEGVLRHCPGCGFVTRFADSGIRRHNANGKTIHRYAIYKCERDHTWNRKLAAYKAGAEMAGDKVERRIDESSGELPLELEAIRRRHSLLLVRLVEVQGRCRLDRLLAQRIAGASRTSIAAWIREGRIRLDGQLVNPSVNVRSGRWRGGRRRERDGRAWPAGRPGWTRVGVTSIR